MTESIATTTLAGALATDILLRREQSLRDRSQQYPKMHSYLSDISECERQMVYSVTNWKDRPPVEPDLKARFDAGNVAEREIVGELRQLGYEVILQQETIEINNRSGELIGRGKIDGLIKYQKIVIPIEAKSMHPNIYDQLDTLEDFQKKPHLRKYLRQLQMYLYGKNVEEGLFIITNCLGHWKLFVVTLDYGEGEQILQRLERVHEALKAKTLPDRIPFRDEICGRCPWAHICLPDVIRKEIDILMDADLIERLDRRAQLQPAQSEFNSIDRKIKDFLKKHQIAKGIAGDFMITTYTQNIKAQDAKDATTRICYEISRVSEIGKGGSE